MTMHPTTRAAWREYTLGFDLQTRALWRLDKLPEKEKAIAQAILEMAIMRKSKNNRNLHSPEILKPVEDLSFREKYAHNTCFRVLLDYYAARIQRKLPPTRRASFGAVLVGDTNLRVGEIYSKLTTKVEGKSHSE